MNGKLWLTVGMALSLSTGESIASEKNNLLPNGGQVSGTEWIAPQDNVGKYICQRPKVKDRLFKSEAV